jgi:hypothetical protein
MSRQTRGLNHAREERTSPPFTEEGITARCAVAKSAMKTITRRAINVTSGIIFKN